MRRPTLAFLALASLASLVPAQVSPAQALPSQASKRHEYDLVDVDWYVRLDPEGQSFAGSVVNTVVAGKDAPLLVFDCAKLTVARVTVDGQSAEFKADGRVLAVASTAKKGDTVKVKIDYSGKPEAGMYFVSADRAFPATTPMVYTQGEMEDTRYWLPTYDEPDDKATFRGAVTVPSDWSVLSNGKPLPTQANGKAKTVRWVQDKPCSTYLISFVAGPYTEVPDGTDPVPVSIWAPKGLEKWGKNAFGGTDAIVRCYAKLTGAPYPWAKYAQSAVADFMFGGMENVSATTQTLDALFPDEVKGTQDGTGLSAHELAHQWFGDDVTTTGWNDVWINEGWATFMPHFYTREKDGEEAYDLERYDTLEAAMGAMRENPDRSMVWNGWKVPMDAFDGYAYPGGAARMFALMHGVGEARFWKATQDYLAEYGGKNVDTTGFFRSFGKSLGADLSTFEKDWFRTPSAPPKIEVSRASGKVTLKQTQAHPFALYLDVWALGKDDVWTKKRVPVRGATTVVEGLPDGPVLVDAEGYFPLEASYEGLTKEERMRLWDHAPNAAAKMRMVGSLMGVLTPEEMNGLVKAASPHLQARLIRYSTSLDDLLTMTKGTDGRLAQAALERLRALPKTGAALSRLQEVWDDTTANPDLRLTAVQSLYALTKDAAVLNAASMTDRYDDGYRTWALGRLAEADPDRARDVALAALKGGATEPVRLTAIAVLGRVKDKPGERRAYDALAAIMTERSNSPLRAAIAALGEYGDKAAIPLLKARQDHGLHFVRGDVTRALAQLGG